MSEVAMNPGAKRWYADARLIILAIFFAGLVLRFVNLSKTPFNAEEAQNAYAAFTMAEGFPAGTAASPVYQGLTALTFYLMRATPFFARFWPALIGASLALVPLLWRRSLGSLQATILAMAFAFDPVLFTLSRQAGGAIFTAVGLIWALSFFVERKPIGFGIMLAIAWLSGAWFCVAVSVCLIGIGLFTLLNKSRDFSEFINTCPFRNRSFRDAAIAAFLISLVSLASAFLLNPRGLSGLAGGLAQLWQSGGGTAKIALITYIYRLIAYSLPVLLFALPTIFIAWKQKDARGQVLSLLAGLMLFGLLVVRNQGSAGFVLLQCLLWPLAVVPLTRQIRLEAGRKDIATGGFFLGLGICGYLAVSAKNLLNPIQTALTIGKSAIAFVLGLLLLVLVFVLIMLGWSLQTARKGVLSAVLLSIIAFSFSLSLLALKTSDPYPGLVWSDSSLLINSSEQHKLLTEIEENGKLEPQVSSVVITDVQLATIRWDLREFRQVDLNSTLPELNAPEIIISTTPDQEKTAESYRGIRLLSPGSVNWRGVPVLDLLRAALSKSLPVESTEYYLWVRQDLITGAVP